MKKNLLFTFFLLCLLPLTVFAQVSTDTVTIVKPQNCAVKVNFTSAITSAVKDTTFTQSGIYKDQIYVVDGTPLSIEVIPNENYDFEKITIGGIDHVDNPYSIESMNGSLTVSSSVVLMRTITVTKPENCKVVINYMPAPSVSTSRIDTIILSSVSENVNLKVKDGTQVTIKVVPDSGYSFENTNIGGTNSTLNPSIISSLTSDKTITASVVKSHTVKVAKPVNSLVKVNYTAPLGSVAKDTTFTSSLLYVDSIVVKDGTDLTVTVTPDTGYEFLNMFIGLDEFTANPKTVTAVSEDLAITTAVVKKKYLVTITSSDHGTISIMKGGIPVTTASLVEHGSELVITASPSTNYILSSLKVNNVAITSGSSKTVTEAITVQAEFTYVIPKYAVTFVQPENGEIIVRKKVVNGSNEAYVQINSGDSIPDGTSLYIYAEPGTNYLVSNILINGIPVENKSDYPLVIEVAGATTIAAQFAIAKQMVTFTPPANGTFTVKNGDTFVNSGDLVDRGTVLTLTAYPNATYKFKMWGDENKDNPREITVGTSNLTVSALFGLITGIEQVYSGMNVYAANNAIYLNGVGTDVTSVSVVDMAGKVVYNNKPELGQTIINPVNRGIYIVVVKGKKGNVSSKVIVK